MLEFFRRLLRRRAGQSSGDEFYSMAGQGRVEEERWQTEEHFEQLVAGVRDYAIFLLDRQGNVLTWNTGAERIKGYQAHEIIGQHFSRFYPPDVIEQDWPAEELRRAAAEGRFEDEGWRIRKDGTRFWASVVITALREKGGEVRGFLKITRDLTERRQAEENARLLLQEEAARQAAEQYAQVIEGHREQLRVTLTSIGDGVITTDAEGRVSLLNPVAETLTGWTNGDAAGQPLRTIFRIVNERTRQPVENPVAKVLATGGIVGLANHTVLIAKDGTERGIDDSGAPIRDSKGNVTGVVVVFRDVTERRRLEQLQRDLQDELQRQVQERTAELRASEERFRLLVEGTRDYAIFLLDPLGRVASWNPGAERIKGYRANEIIGQHFSRFYPQDAIDRGWPKHELEVAYKEGRFEDEGWRLMDHLPGLAWIKDLQGRYVYANDAAVTAFNISRAELYGKTDQEVFPPDTASQFRENDLRALGSETGVQVIETLEDEAGILHRSIASKFPILGPDGRAVLVGGMAIDATERLRAEEALREADRRKDEFLAMLAHELRNPLAPIRNALYIMKQAGNGYDVARWLRQRPGLERVVLVAMTGWGQEEDRRRSQEAGFDYHLIKPVEPEALHKLLAGTKVRLS